MTRSMKPRLRRSLLALALGGLLTIGASPCPSAEGQPAIEFDRQPGAVPITAAGEPVATYFYADQEIARPFFAHVHAPGGVPVTRNHPPRPGIDETDHGTAGNYFHPGIWLAFSNLNGSDYWRLKAAVRHEAFVDEPAIREGRGTFTVRNSYRDQQHSDVTVANEICRYTILALPSAYLLVSDSLFWSDDRELSFGDEEEMGLAVRVATRLAVKHGGRLLASTGRTGEKQIRGQNATWCDYSGMTEGRHAGVLLVPDSANSLTSRYHARDYGLLAANPFARQSLDAGDKLTTNIARGESLRLRFAVVLHSGAKMNEADNTSVQSLHKAVVKILAELPRPAR